MIQGLKAEGNWRYHPDMPKKTKAEKKAAMQYHALKKSSSQRVTSNSALKQISRSQWEGSPTKKARALEDKNPEPGQKEPLKAIGQEHGEEEGGQNSTSEERQTERKTDRKQTHNTDKQ